MESFILSNGMNIPAIGFGCYALNPPEQKRILLDAIEAGYRHFDTASFYQTEEALGQAVRESGIPRESFFLTTKLWRTQMDDPRAAFEASLRALGTDYLDLYLIHWPANEKQFGDRAAEINAETWRAMEEAYHEGKIRALGVSNFMPHHIIELMKTAEVAPAVDQIEVHPGWPHVEEVKYLQAHNILVEGWAPLGGQDAKVMTNPTILQLAEKYDKTPAQLCLRCLVQRGVLPLPKSVHKERMVQNTQLFDFEISDEDMQKITALPNLGGQCADPDAVDF